MLPKLIFHPLAILCIALTAALLFAIAIEACFDGAVRSLLLYYYVPVGVPFVAYSLDRAQRWRQTARAQWLIDAFVLALSLTRAFVQIPLVSGHALFLIYALLTTRSWVVHVTALAVMLQVIHLKLFILSDLTLFGGGFLGILAAIAARLIERKENKV
jgi:hypothetical protein